MKILGVIPARYASTRFPAKPLVDILGKSMIQRVYEQCKQASLLTEVIVATDDIRIFDHVQSFGGKVMMTATSHQSGTERMCEVAQTYSDYTHYINIQGDEPYIQPEQINLLCQILLTGTPIATLIKKMKEVDLLENPNIIKVVIDTELNALYFSRSPIPYCRGENDKSKWLEQVPYYQHIGIYGFKREVLLQIPQMQVSYLEQVESLEQLRWLANGYQIKTAISEQASISIDTPADLERLLHLLTH